MENRRTALRNAGALVALSTPITAFIAFALASIAVGEDRLESQSGVTTLGYLVMAAPLVLGLTIAAWAHVGGPIPSNRVATVALGLFGLFCVCTGVWSIGQSGADANIGAGLLVLFGIITLGASFGLRALASTTPPPPPPTTPAPPTARER